MAPPPSIVEARTTDQSLPQAGSTKFRPRARLIHLIGKELISDEPVALVELVKNSYDADAENVEISFTRNGSDGPVTIVVSDDGHGMDVATVLGEWLEPGTISKKRRRRSPQGRVLQGEKGIGRFAAARLGDSLLMETKKKGTDKVVTVVLEWGTFDEDSFLDEVEVDYEVSDSPDDPDGTRLTIEGAPSRNWDRLAFQTLHSRLSRLVSPFEEVRDFNIRLEVDWELEFSGPVDPPQLILRPMYRLKGALAANRSFSGTLEIGTTKQKIDQQLGPDGKALDCGPFEIDIRVWDRDIQSLKPIAQQEHVAVTEVRKLLNLYCGVSIYRDGFRVHPYGERGHDWLNLDLRSRLNPVRNVANNQVIAAIKISRDFNAELRDRSNREGIIKNAAHDSLMDWFREILTILEAKRYQVKPRKKNIQRTAQMFSAFDLSSEARESRKLLGAEHPLTKQIDDRSRQVAEGVKDVQEVFSRLLFLSGLGHMVDIVIHEIGTPVGKVARELMILEKRLHKLVLGKALSTVQPSLVRIRRWIKEIYLLRKRLDPQTPSRRGRAEHFKVQSEMKSTFELYRRLIELQNINLTFSGPEDPLNVCMSRAVLAQIVSNLFDNSLYWVTQEHGSGQGGRVDVALNPTEHGFVVSVSDDGPGVPEEHRARVFESYFSTKPHGTGLGLYISRLLIEPYGELRIGTGGVLPGACFEAAFEKGVGR